MVFFVMIGFGVWVEHQKQKHNQSVTSDVQSFDDGEVPFLQKLVRIL